MENKFGLLLECNQNLRNHIQDFINIFVDYYGEEQRPYIEQRFNSTALLGFLTIPELSRILKNISKNESNKLFKTLLKNTNLPVNKTLLFGLEDDENLLDFKEKHPIYKYKLFYEEFILGEKGRKEKYYNELFKELQQHEKNLDITFNQYMEMVRTRRSSRKIYPN